MKPHYEVRNQASGVKGVPTALFGPVKIHILTNADTLPGVEVFYVLHQFSQRKCSCVFIR